MSAPVFDERPSTKRPLISLLLDSDCGGRARQADAQRLSRPAPTGSPGPPPPRRHRRRTGTFGARSFRTASGCSTTPRPPRRGDAPHDGATLLANRGGLDGVGSQPSDSTIPRSLKPLGLVHHQRPRPYLHRQPGDRIGVDPANDDVHAGAHLGVAAGPVQTHLDTQRQRQQPAAAEGETARDPSSPSTRPPRRPPTRSVSGAEGHRFESCRARQHLRPFSPEKRAFLLGLSVHAGRRWPLSRSGRQRSETRPKGPFRASKVSREVSRPRPLLRHGADTFSRELRGDVRCIGEARRRPHVAPCLGSRTRRSLR